MQFLEQKPLQPLSNLLFGSVYSRLRQQTTQIQVFSFKTQVVFGKPCRSSGEPKAVPSAQGVYVNIGIPVWRI